jgi:signal transduction histidine kinase
MFSLLSFFRKTKKPEPSKNSEESLENPKILADSLYKQNKEISGKNKTLSLLGRLYEISILTLGSKDLASRISQTVQSNFGFDLVGVLLYNRESDALTPLALASSDRLRKIKSASVPVFTKSPVPLSKTSLFNSVVKTKTNGVSRKIDEVWGPLVSDKVLSSIKTQANIKSTLAYPLIIQNDVIGVLVLSLNRLYDNLAEFEKESIKNFINVIAVALDKAILYEQLKINNEQLKIMDLARAEFISIASHQLRTPPATIKWYLAAVLAGDYGRFNPKIRTALEKSQLTNNTLISLIDDMLNASRIERGKMEFLFEYTDVEKLTEETVMELTPQAIMHKLKLEYKKPKIKLPQILADKEKLQQVVNNLIDNAIKYTKTGTVSVELSKTASDLVIKVKDTGKGLAPGEHDAIFQKYGRGKDSQKHASGLGLGLYVAKVVVEHHKGKIRAESPGLNKGTTFIVTLPLKTDLKAETFDLTKNQMP